MAGEKDKIKGSIKEGVGEATGDERLRSEGKGDKAKGNVKDAAHNIKEAVKGDDRPQDRPKDRP